MRLTEIAVGIAMGNEIVENAGGQAIHKFRLSERGGPVVEAFKRAWTDRHVGRDFVDMPCQNAGIGAPTC